MPSLNTKLASAPNTQANYVLKATSSTTIGNSLIFDNGTNVGIGTTTPAEKLSVIGNIKLDNGAADGAQLVLASSGFSDWNIDNFSGSLRAYYGASVALSISSSLAATFSSSVSASGSFISNVTNGYGLRLNRAAVTNFNGISHATGGVERWFVGMRENLSSNNYVIYNEAIGADAFTISTSNNNIGIGTSSPLSNLQINGNNATVYDASVDSGQDDGGVTLTIRNNDTSTVGSFSQIDMMVSGDSGRAVGRIVTIRTASATSDMAFVTESGNTKSEKMRITSGGNIGMATTSPAALLTLKGRGGADIIFQMNDESNIRRCFYIPNQYYGYMWAVGVVSNGGKAFSFGNQDGTEVGTIVVNAGGVAYNTTSDYRLKEDLRDFNGLEKVEAIKVYDFKWKNLDERIDGVIAHELAEVVPYAVSGVKDALNHEGNIEAQSVDYSKLTPILIKAIQELSQKVTQQQEQINQLINK